MDEGKREWGEHGGEEFWWADVAKAARASPGPQSTPMAILGRLTPLAPGGRAEGALSREPVGGSRGKMEAQES